MHGNALFKIILILLAVYFLMVWYTYNGLKTLTKGWRSDRLRKGVRWTFLVLTIGAAVAFEVNNRWMKTAYGMTPVHEWIVSLFLVFFLTMLVFCLILLLKNRIYRINY